MEPVTFFDTILPAAGLRIAAVPAKSREGRPYFKHFYGDTSAWLAQATQHLDANRQMNVFYALGGYNPDGEKDDFGRVKRVQSNVIALRSFWLDLDVGDDPKKYASQREAADAILAFASHVGLPTPYLVKSGGGVHVYWPMDADLEPEVWRTTAMLLKAACRVEGVKADPSRTADCASVLRPPGVHHRKAEPKPVRVVVEGQVSTLAAFQQALVPYAMHVELGPTDDLLGPPPAHIQGLASIEDLRAGVEHRPCSSRKIADGCGVFQLMRDHPTQVDQPTWYYTLGVMAFTKDGVELAHEWSAPHPEYSREETDRKISQVTKIGHPTSCAKLADYQPAICAACPHNGMIKTPYSLGTFDPGAQVVSEKTVRTESGGFKTIRTTIELPDGFTTHNKKLCSYYKDEQDQWQTEPFCESVFWPVNRLWIEGVAYVECEMETREGKRRFLIEGGTIGKGKDTLAAELGRQEIVTMNGKGVIMDGYMKRWMTHLKDTAEQHTAYRHFGWSGDGPRSFVFGDTVMHRGEGETRALLVGMAKSRAPALVARGDLATWVDGVHRAYSAPGQEAYQFLVACGFAAPLLSMMKQVSGVTVYAHSEGSGAGKTTAQKVALSIWGDWEQLMMAEGKTTPNAMWGLMGAYHSLPIVYDELTNQKNDVASELVFSVSSGRSKERMRADGELRENNSHWCTILLASGNTLLSEKLALHRGNAEAEMSRLFEFTMYTNPHLTPNQANAIFPQVLQNHGQAGRVFARYVVENYDAVAANLLTTQARLNDELGITQVERYWSALFAAVYVAMAICRMTGLLSFDVKALKAWMVERLSENRVQRNDAANDPLELFGSMLADLWQGILVTHGEGDMRKGQAASVVEKPRGQLIGRAILPDGRNTNAVLLLNHNAVRDWANKKGVSSGEMFKAAVAAQWAEKDHVRYALGRGTVEYANTSSYIRCWKVNPERIVGVDAGKLVSEKLGTVQGGRGNASAGVA